MFTRKTTLFGLAALLVLGTFATAQGLGRDHRHGRFGERGERRAAIKQFVRGLEITDYQRAQALTAAKAIAPIAQSARSEARTIIENARKANPTGDRKAIRESVRESLEALRERAVTQALPIARGVLDTLTPEQKDKLRAAAEKHGRTFDAEKAARRIGFLLARPRAVEFLEARTKR
jgi:Spy/CpxP family protein refolding chaperone